MATAAVNLKDHVTCPVCLDIFDEPKVLKCLHTICDSCIESLQRFNTVTCPVCREISQINQVKSDFKTRALVDLYKGNDNGEQSTMKTRKTVKATSNTDPRQMSVQLCSLCKKHEIATYCCQCKVLICGPCRESHPRIPSCKDHTFGFNRYRKDQAEQLLEAVKGLPETGIGSPNEQLRFNGEVQGLEDEAIREIREAEKKAMTEVKKHHQTLIGQVQLKKFKILNTRAAKKDELKHLSLELQQRVTRYSKEMEQSAGQEVTLENILQDTLKIALFQQEINQIKERFSVRTCACRTVIHVKQQEYNDETGTKVIFKERAHRCLIQ